MNKHHKQILNLRNRFHKQIIPSIVVQLMVKYQTPSGKRINRIIGRIAKVIATKSPNIFPWESP